MKIHIKRTDDDFAMLATNENGNTIEMDGPISMGGHHKGMRPMQLMLTALGGCSAIDIINILKKQRQDIQSLEIEIEASSVKVDEYSVYKDVLLHFQLVGKIDADKAIRAAELSFSKYCSVSKALEYSSNISYTISINGEKVY